MAWKLARFSEWIDVIYDGNASDRSRMCMDNRFFEEPILNSPYEYPMRHWELDADGQPTQQIIESRRAQIS